MMENRKVTIGEFEYLINRDEIKKGEWLLSMVVPNIPQYVDVCTEVDHYDRETINYNGLRIKWTSGKHCWKVIATNDPKLIDDGIPSLTTDKEEKPEWKWFNSLGYHAKSALRKKHDFEGTWDGFKVWEVYCLEHGISDTPNPADKNVSLINEANNSVDCKEIISYLTLLQGETGRDLSSRDDVLQYCIQQIKNIVVKEYKETVLTDLLSGLVRDVSNLLAEHDIEWQEAGYYTESKRFLKNRNEFMSELIPLKNVDVPEVGNEGREKEYYRNWQFEEQFRIANPQTIGETDKHFYLDNYKDWLEKQLAITMRELSERITPTQSVSVELIKRALELAKTNARLLVTLNQSADKADFEKAQMIYNHAQYELGLLVPSNNPMLTEAVEIVNRHFNNANKELSGLNAYDQNMWDCITRDIMNLKSNQ